MTHSMKKIFICNITKRIHVYILLPLDIRLNSNLMAFRDDTPNSHIFDS